MPARPTRPVATPVTMAGQSETLTACTAAAIASCIGIPSILHGAEPGLLLFRRCFVGTFPCARQALSRIPPTLPPLGPRVLPGRYSRAPATAADGCCP